MGAVLKGNRRVWLITGIAGFILALSIGVYLYQGGKDRNKYSHLPPVVQEMISRNDAVVASTIAIYNASAKLDSLGMVQSRVTDIKTTIDQIEKMRGLIAENQQAIDNLVSYIGSHADLIQTKGLDWAFYISEFYTDRIVTRHSRSRTQYFDAFETFLKFTYDNFDAIMEEKSIRHRANYDAYYLRYRGVADRYNQINRERIQFQDRFSEAHPAIKPFLPGSHHLEPFKFWDRFSF